MQIINGKVTQEVSYTYTYVVQANKEGKFTIPPAEVKVDNKVYKSNSINIEVIKGTKKQDNQGNNAATVNNAAN